MNSKTIGVLTAALVGLSIGATVSLAGTAAGTGVVLSKHDMNLTAPGTDAYGRVCAFCHTPHHALKDVSDPGAYMPLWSHTLTAQTYTPYQSATLDAEITDVLQGPSRLCMSCHDGVIAVDQHYAMPTGAVIKTGDSWNQIAVGASGDLTNDHPIGFIYGDVVIADSGIKSADTVFNGNPNGTTINDVLTNGVMTCATCHEVHNKDNVSTGNYNYFLYAPEEGSAICLTCHNK